MNSKSGSKSQGPLENLEQWDEFLKERYPQGETVAKVATTNQIKKKEEFRDYRSNARPGVREFYQQNHRFQTLDFVRRKREEYLSLNKRRMSIWEGMEYLNTLVDDSDPDTDLSQIEHLLQTAEAIRKDGHPRWFILTGLIHDLGKLLCLFGEPQWAVVGDTFPVGCAFSDKVVFPEFFAENPDSQVAEYQTPCGIYRENCGLDSVHISWGHDEYLYQVVKDFLPSEALAMIRYHSFYAAHREGAYANLMNERDSQLMDWVRAFNPYDLYTKSAARPNVAELRPFYEDLINEYFPPVLRW
ncbi:MAG TPA: inositol oxygenase family protein [Gemmataceae bacterium]|nr:inositol oxygenase family protein [Gemmataceae bacterium]